MQLLCLCVPRTGSACRCLKNKHIAKALCFQWQDGWEKRQPLAVTFLSCQLLAAMRMYVRYLLRRALHLILPDGRGMIHTHINNARMMDGEKTFSFCFLFVLQTCSVALIAAKTELKTMTLCAPRNACAKPQCWPCQASCCTHTPHVPYSPVFSF